MSDPVERALKRLRDESPELTDEQAAALGQRKGVAAGVPADLEAMLPPVPDPVDDAVVDAVVDPAPEVVRPCKVCGESLEGEHPRRLTCKRCQREKQNKVSTAFNEAKAAEPETPRVLPDLECVPGQTVAVDGLVIALYRHLKHDIGLSKNGIREVIDGLLVGEVPAHAVDIALELDRVLDAVPFASMTLVQKRVQICRALTQCWGKDVSGQWRVF